MSLFINTNNGPIYHECNVSITNHYYPQQPNRQAQMVMTENDDETERKPTSIPPDFFCVSARFTEENIRERLNAELSCATTKINYCRSLYRLQNIGCINIDQYASDTQRAIVLNRFQSKFNLFPSDFCKARLSR
jgi:hypothetical protein